MKILDPTFKESLSKTSTTLCWCWLITRIDGVQLGFTSLDLPFQIDGVSYLPYTGFDPGAAQTSGDLGATDSQQLKGLLGASGISPADLVSGIYEYASVRRFLVDYTNLPSSLSSNPPKHLELPQGHLAESKRNPLGYEIKVKDDLTLLDNQIGETTSKTCRASLGDDRCRVNLAPFSHNLTIIAVESNRIFDVNGSLPAKYFDRGRLLFTSGNNSGIHRDIGFYFGRGSAVGSPDQAQVSPGNKMILSPVPAPFEVEIGDTVLCVAGCVKTKLACVIKFRNFRNFVGEPDIPTTDLSVDTPSK